ncbi:hypothetical protein B9Z55_026852 [Caenorhabditis nigoni]|uniref:Globin domain-containing protein n=1 Tax=Caenorhabditis nigoni TaxID=1611254 RepID=A0A2G5SHP7_9PELO|nr:hypothetical protein B9Z55_026852 [Caenorhabditis nigoni]
MYRQLLEQHIEVNAQREPSRSPVLLREPEKSTVILPKIVENEKKSEEKEDVVEKAGKITEKPNSQSTSSEKENAGPTDPIENKRLWLLFVSFFPYFSAQNMSFIKIQIDLASPSPVRRSDLRDPRRSLFVTKNDPIPDYLLAQKIIDETSRLSDRQREILQKTFTSIEQDCVRNGLKIFVRLFAEYPRYKLIWPQFRAIPDSSLMNAVELRRHASVYLKGLGKIIESMRDEEELRKSMSRIALAHIKWNVQRNHVIHMIEPVLEVVKECNGYQLDDETRQAWTVLYQVIANLIEVFRCRALND